MASTVSPVAILSAVGEIPSLCGRNLPPRAANSSPSSHGSSPFFVAFKVLQLVRTLRKGAKKRVGSKSSKNDFCQETERRAYEQIDKYLGRKRRQSSFRTGNHLSKPAILNAVLTQGAPSSVYGTSHQLSSSSQFLESALDYVDSSVKYNNQSLKIIARCHTLFVQRKTDFRINKRLSIKRLARLLVVVRDLANEIGQVSTNPDHQALRDSDPALNPRLNEAYLANLEHLLLCLEEQLVQRLISVCIDLVQKHLEECQKDQGKHCQDWFFEFPDARHPLSTTWPWSIRPSLAVIWGVCWMFYDFNFDSERNLVDDNGVIVLPSFIVDQVRQADQRQQQNRFTVIPTLEFEGQFERIGAADPFADFLATRASLGSSFAAPHQAATLDMSISHSQTRSGDQAGDSRLRIAGADTNNAYPNAAAPSSYADSTYSARGWVPQEYSPSSSADLNLHQDSAYPVDVVATWPAYVQQPQGAGYDPSRSLPQRSPSHLTPTIRVTTDFTNSAQAPGFSQPQETIYSPSYPSSLPPQQQQPQPFPFNQYPSGHLGLQRRTYRMQQDSDMQTPISPGSTHPSPRDPAVLDPGTPRKRSHSVMSQQGVPGTDEHRSRSASIVSAVGPSPTDEYSSRGSRSHRRGDPPINAENKYYCDFSEECQGQTFDRKCEWSKHMDKHDRPYRCPHPSCAKLQGFTYSGGLLRHEREVHGKHGGPKAQLMCPYQDCKRHVGKGFTRKENLNEHLRRVHASKDPHSQTFPFGKDTQETSMGFEDVETPASRISDAADHEDLTSPVLFKRRRLMHDQSELSASEDVEDLKQEVKRLRKANELKDEHSRQMQALVTALEDKVRALEEQLQQQTRG